MVRVLPMKRIDAAAAREVMTVNALSAMEIVRILLQKKINAKALRSVVFLSSIHAIRGVKGNAAYAASKGALDAFMRAMALELAPAVRVNSVAPGGVPTPMSRRDFEDETARTRLEAEYPMGLGEVEDIVNAVEFLLSRRAKWITGQQLVVDGGRTLL